MYRKECEESEKLIRVILKTLSKVIRSNETTIATQAEMIDQMNAKITELEQLKLQKQDSFTKVGSLNIENSFVLSEKDSEIIGNSDSSFANLE